MIAAPLFERHAATEALTQLLAACAEGDVVSYEDMCRVTNRDLRGSDRHLVAAARKAAMQEHGAVFGTVIRVGLRRLRPQELIQEGGRQIKRIGRAAKRGGRTLDTCDIKRLSSDERLQHAATRGILAAIENSAQRPTAQPAQRSRDPIVKVA